MIIVAVIAAAFAINLLIFIGCFLVSLLINVPRFCCILIAPNKRVASVIFSVIFATLSVLAVCVLVLDAKYGEALLFSAFYGLSLYGGISSYWHEF